MNTTINNHRTPPVVSGALPVVGHALQFRQDVDALDRRGHAEHGDVFTIKLGNRNVATVTGAEYNKLFYMQTDESLNITDVYGFLKAAFGEVLFTAPKEVYYNQRAVLQSLFGRKQMARYVDAMQFEVQKWIDSLGTSGMVDISEAVLPLTQYVAAHSFIGPNFRDDFDETFWDDYGAISRSLDPILPPNLPLPKFIQRDRAVKRLHATMQEVIEKRRRHPERYEDMITHLFEQPQKDGKIMSDEEITGLFLGLLFAGHETTAGQAAWTIIQLLQHPDYLQRVETEVAEHVQLGQPLDGRTLRNLKHIYWAIDETTRLRPSASMQLRLVEEPVEVNDYTVPAGWMMRVNAATSHFQPSVYAHPEAYDPLRFSPERREGTSFDIIGFGGGIHKCTGMNFAKNEMAIITALLVQQFELELASPEPPVVTGAGATRPGSAMIRYRARN